MLKSFGTIFLGLLSIIKYPLIFLICLYLLFFMLFGIFLLWEYHKGRRPAPTSVRHVRRPNLIYSLFILTPKQMVEDYINRPADFFKPQGLIIFTGRQGRGKTVAMAEYIQHLQACYPKSKCITNFDFKYQDDALLHWKQLIDYKNTHKGVIVGMDELQNWFSSNQSKNFPPEMLSVITQNRKNRRVILGTSQNFYLLAKAIRSQATEVRECMTLAGCFTIVRCREPILDDKGDVKEWKNRGWYWFTHTPKIRNSYDTYKVIESLSEAGFVDRKPPQAYDEA